MRSLISIADLTNDEIEEIFSLADQAEQLRTAKAASGQIMATLFYAPSTRTRLSFEAAMQRLGGRVLSTEHARAFSSEMEGEQVEDSIRIIGSYSDVIVIRHHEEGGAWRA